MPPEATTGVKDAGVPTVRVETPTSVVAESAAVIVSEKEADPEIPDELVMVMVWVVAPEVISGSPEMVPVEVLKSKPKGRLGEMAYLSAPVAPVAMTGTKGVIEALAARETVGSTVETTMPVPVMVREKEAWPAAPVASVTVTTNEVVDPVAVGVPKMEPVDEVIDRPAGRAGETV